jgi:thiamine pyrophosphate-dependent acetolactate synthase large subunit-like protein
VTDSASKRAAQRASAAGTAAIDRPVPSGVNAAQFGSDVAADALRATGVEYIALNPGASYRGLHDSLVNYLGNERPQMLLCLHEESAIAIAHGYAKVTGRAMAAAVHSNVGLMHGTMAIFNAWCDRMPIVILGATGPVDAVKRRPWIDWIHTASDQGALIRGYSKWDDQPASPAAAREAILRAAWIANTSPCGPTYVNLDAGMQEGKLEEPLAPVDAQRLMPALASAPAADAVAQTAALLRDAKRVVILAGRVSRRAPRCARRHRYQDRRRLPYRSPAAYWHAHLSGADSRRNGRHPCSRCHSQPRLDRPRRHAEAGGQRERQDRAGFGRPSPA